MGDVEARRQMTANPQDDRGRGRTDSQRKLGAGTAVLLVIASMVGTGIFTTSGLLVGELRSTPAVLLVWLIGGLLALCGALSYAELTAALPRNGGEYRLLSRIYHPSVGFAAGWVSLVVGFSAPLAAGALAFGLYLQAVSPGVDPTVAAVGLTLGLTALHAVHVTFGSSLHNLFTAANIGLVLVFVVGGAFAGSPGAAFSGGSLPLQDAVFSPAFAVALVFVSFAYSGWNGAAYLAGEVRNPARSLPRALVAGTALVVLLYVGLNIVFLSAAPPGELSGVVEIGHLAARRLFGEQAGAVLTGAIALALVSSGSAMMMAGPRVYHAMGEDYARLSFLRYRTRRGGPALAVVLQGAAALVMVLTSSFDALLTYLGITLSLSAGLTVAGVLVLRVREPALARPYRTWGYPLTPLLFLGLSSWMIVHAVSQRPVVALAGAATVASGLLLYLPLARGRCVASGDERPAAAPAGSLAPGTG